MKCLIDFLPLHADILMEVVKKVTVNPTIPANLLTSVRAVTNLFKNSCYYNWLQKHRSEVSSSLFLFIFHLDYLKELIISLENQHYVEIFLCNTSVLKKVFELISSLINIELFMALFQVLLVCLCVFQCIH